jgi:hypothetical protein
MAPLPIERWATDPSMRASRVSTCWVRLGNMIGGVPLGVTHWLVSPHVRVSR